VGCSQPSSTSALIAPHRDALARYGAFADARRIADVEGGADVLRACAALVASFAAGVRAAGLEWLAPFHAGLLISTFRCYTPVRCGAGVDERRIVGGDKADAYGRETLIRA